MNVKLNNIQRSNMRTRHLAILSATFTLLSACATGDKPCEEILEVKRQEQMCEQLRKTMNNANYPQQALTAKKRYEEACLQLRYYRDEYDTICKAGERAIGERRNN